MLRQRWYLGKTALILLLVLTLAVAAACGSGSPGDETDDQQGTDLPQDEQGGLEWRILNQEDLTEEIAAWIDDRKEEVGIFQEIFDDETVILVSWGEKRTAGYAVAVEALAEVEPGRLQIYVELTEPDEEEDSTGQVVTYPYAVVAVTPALYYELEPLFAGALFLQNSAFRIEEPEMFAVIDDTLRVKGTARVFEAMFMVYLEDGHLVLAEMPVMADAGAPEWGAFEVEVPLETVPTSPSGILMIYESSAKDGSPVNVLTIPVRFANWE
ncbi:MAG TPA: Gmad2 immunoglobulin-like domain-containing protein [Sphingobacteriaceae bacterium]|nr:Gmad2 immunoglobulin-like domain-containing protein [Sphingobacteriaceae bacterium]